MALTPTQGDLQGRPYKNTVPFNPFASPCTATLAVALQAVPSPYRLA
jgi:hypothetical protein